MTVSYKELFVAVNIKIKKAGETRPSPKCTQHADCNGGGECRFNPQERRKICVCEVGYSGEMCEGIKASANKNAILVFAP